MSIVLNGATGITAPDIDVTAQTTVAAFDAGITLGGSATTLDDYEEGTWTPTALNAASSLTTAEGTYTKIGNLVRLDMNITFGATGNSNACVFGGMPFTASAASKGDGGFKVTGDGTFVSAYFVLTTQLRPLSSSGSPVSYTTAAGKSFTFTILYKTDA